METLSRLVTESLARHGFDRPLDYRRLQWSHWFRCESHHSLLVVPSKPGVFALAEEVMDLASAPDHGGTEASSVPRSLSEAKASVSVRRADTNLTRAAVEERRFSACPEQAKRAEWAASDAQKNAASAAEVQLASREPNRESPSRMLAVAQFYEDDDMAFVLDRMLSHENPMRTRLASGHYFVRFVVIEDPFQRRSVCNALNQWIVSSAEKATGIGSHFATSLEFTSGAEQGCVATAASTVPGTLSEAKGSSTSGSLKSSKPCDSGRPTTAARLNSAIATTIHGSSSFPSGF